MAFCTNCGKELKEKVKFCPECGNEVAAKTVKKKEKEEENVIEKVLDTPDSTDKFTKKDASDNLGMALLSYLSFLVFIPFFANKNSKFVTYHAKQGMNLLIIEGFYIIVYNLLSLIKVSKSVTYWGYVQATVKVIPWWITAPLTIVGILIGALSIIGIVYVCQGKAKELPIVGKLKIVK